MYTEEPRRRIDWVDVFKKAIVVILILLIIFLIIWLFAKNNKNSNKVNVNYDGNTKINETNNNNNDNEFENINNEVILDKNAYTESFITNYTYFHSTARDYVEKNELPGNNSSIRYTLQELIDKKLLLRASYGNTTCDSNASYVIVTNKDGKYVMTTTLVCGTEIAKTEEELKCSLLCGNCNKEKTAIEYEFKQAYSAKETTYSCPSGYTKTGTGSSTKCIKNGSNVVKATQNIEYTCASGYTKTGSGANTKCVKNGTETVKAKATTTYSCDNGYTLSGNKCVKNSSDTKDAKATTTYSCDKGYTLNGTKCVKTITDTKEPNKSYSCDKGDLVNTSYCRVYTTSSYYQSYNSYYGRTYNGCSYSGSYTTPCTNCSGSTRTVYSYLCYKTSYEDVGAKVSFSCSEGYVIKAGQCVRTLTDTKDAKKTTTYSCDNGYTLSGTKCVKNLSDTKDAKKTTTYSCEKGKLNGTNCIIDNNSIIAATKNVTYTCAAGYTKQGLAESSICTKGNVTTVNPTKKTKTVTKYRTKWSKEKSLKGWIRTGKTRTVKAS